MTNRTLKTYATFATATQTAQKLVDKYTRNDCRVTYIIQALANGRFTPIMFCDGSDDIFAIGNIARSATRAMRGHIMSNWNED